MSSQGGVTDVEPTPDSAGRVFGARLELAERYAGLLCGDGVLRGVIGPREGARIWTRHLLNSAAVAELIGPDARIADVGSGAGLPGLALAIARPDLRVALVEPLQRRVDFLHDTITALGLHEQVEVVRGRADEVAGSAGGRDWVCARAVAPLDRLVRWCLPLLAPDGRLALIKGARAQDEVDEHRAALRKLRTGPVNVVSCGVGLLEPPVTVVTVEARGVARGK